MKYLSHYAVLAEMFRYPSESLKEHCTAWKRIVLKYGPDLITDLEPFVYHLENTSLQGQQEYYVSTFDVKPLCCLDIGHVLFGDDFRRGQFMANLKAEHRKAGNDIGTELPDNLPVLLSLFPKLQDSDLAEELAYSLVTPAVKEIISGFRSADNHYKALLRIVVAIMENDFEGSKFERFQFASRKRQYDISKPEKAMPE